MKYRNLFKEKTEVELVSLYKQFLDFERTGVIAEDIELGKIRDQYCEWFESNPLLMLERDLLHVISDFWLRNMKPYDDTKKYRYKIEFSGGDGVCEGTIVLTEAEAQVVGRAMDIDNWDDLYMTMYSAWGDIDIEHPVDVSSAEKPDKTNCAGE